MDNQTLSNTNSSPLEGGREGSALEGRQGGASLFSTFFHIGLFTIGGGYAMIPLIEAEVVDKKQWISREELLDLMAVAQSCPGIFAVNIAIFIGYRLRGVAGALMSTLGRSLRRASSLLHPQGTTAHSVRSPRAHGRDRSFLRS